MARKRKLTVPEQHQLRVARKTMRMNSAMAGVMGGPNKTEAARTIKALTGSRSYSPSKGQSAHARASRSIRKPAPRGPAGIKVNYKSGQHTNTLIPTTGQGLQQRNTGSALNKKKRSPGPATFRHGELQGHGSSARGYGTAKSRVGPGPAGREGRSFNAADAGSRVKGRKRAGASSAGMTSYETGPVSVKAHFRKGRPVRAFERKRRLRKG